MNTDRYLRKARTYLNTLCSVRPHRRLGSPGNRQATDFFAGTLQPWGYQVDTTPFACLDHVIGATSLTCGDHSFKVHASPYSLGCSVTAELVVVSTVKELAKRTCRGKLLLLRGDLSAEQLMPKNFVFYNPDHHKKIYALLEAKRPAAIITATEKRPELVGAIYPFPMIEDGDFDIPSVYCRETVGAAIAKQAGDAFRLMIEARRIPSTGCNVIAHKNREGKRKKIIVCAHIDARESTPGASDNASGVVVELLLAEMLKSYRGPLCVEIAALNGEDHYSAAGQMDYLRRYGRELDAAVVAVNIDDVGYRRGKSAYSLYECPPAIRRKTREAFGKYPGMLEGPPWYQGDHMIFVQNAKAAMAITAENAADLMRTVTHTAKDTPALINCRKLVEVARAMTDFITQW